MHISTVVDPEKFKIGVSQGVSKSYSEPFLPILKFSTLELCYIWLVPSLEYLCAYFYSWCPGKIQNLGPSGGHINPF